MSFDSIHGPVKELRVSLFQTGYFIGLILISLTLPTKWIQLNNVCILLTFSIWIIEQGVSKRLSEILKNPLFIGLSMLYPLYILSLTYSQNVALGLSNLEARFTILILPLMILSYYKIEAKLFDDILTAFLISCLCVSMACLVYTFYDNHLKGLSYSFDTSYQYSSFSLIDRWGFHPSYFSAHCAFCVFIIISFFRAGKINLISAIILIGYFFAFQMLLASRVCVLAQLIVLVLTILYYAYVYKKLWIGLVSSFVFSAVVFLGFYSSGTLRVKLYAMFNYEVNIYNAAFKFDNRLTMWRSSYAIFKDHFFYGVGLGDQKSELEKLYLSSDCELCIIKQFDSHNVFLDAAVTVGVLGLLAVIVVFTMSFYQAIKKRNILHLQFLTIFVLFSLVEATFSVHKGVVFFFFFNTLFLSRYRELKDVYNPKNIQETL